MSVSIDPKKGVRVKTAQKPGRIVAGIIIALEAIFSVFLYMSLAERVFVVLPAAAQPGVPELIAYQGLLTDTSGNPLGGAGSIYCFRYSIWDSQSGGSQLWPQPAIGDASTTPTNSTTTVTDGVFSDELGRTDTLSGLDFGADTTGSSTYFLQVQVSTSSLTCATGLETLTPRQQITSDAWSQTAQSVYGNQLRTLVTNNTVQIGTGGGVASGTQTLLSLDVVNTGDTIGGSCSQNGTLWYDSTLQKALVCANHLVQPFSNGTSTINSIGTNGTTTLISSGEALFSAGANITISQNGSVISFVGPAAGAAPATLSNFQWPAGQASSFNVANPQGGFHFGLVNLQQILTATRAMALVSGSIASNSSGGLTVSIGIFTRNGSTLSMASSGSQSYTYTSNASSAVSGLRRVSVPLNISATPGDYWYAVGMSTANAGTFTLYGGAMSSVAYSGNIGFASATSAQMIAGVGSTTSNAMPGSIAVSVIQGNAAGANMEPWILFSDFDLNN